MDIIQPSELVELYHINKMMQISTTCFWCNSATKLTKDHIIPRCAGGTLTRNNIVAACLSCNRERGLIADLVSNKIRHPGAKLIKREQRLKPLITKWALKEVELLGKSPSLSLVNSSRIY